MGKEGPLKKTTLLTLIWLLSVLSLTAVAQQPQPGSIKPPAVQTDSARRQEAFEIVWRTVNQTFFDPKFGGVDWRAVHER
jgi:carboxyl-terminal processing protease